MPDGAWKMEDWVFEKLGRPSPTASVSEPSASAPNLLL